jgi:hypothetical protein
MWLHAALKWDSVSEIWANLGKVEKYLRKGWVLGKSWEKVEKKFRNICGEVEKYLEKNSKNWKTQSACAVTESACSHHAHKIWFTFTLLPAGKWIQRVHAEDSVPYIGISHNSPPYRSTSGTPSFAKR